MHRFFHRAARQFHPESGGKNARKILTCKEDEKTGPCGPVRIGVQEDSFFLNTPGVQFRYFLNARVMVSVLV